MQHLAKPNTLDACYAQPEPDDDMRAEQWLTVADIAQRMQVHEQTVRRWLRTGMLRGHNFGGKAGYRVEESDLAHLLERLDREDEGRAEAIEDAMQQLEACRGEVTRLRGLLVRAGVDPDQAL